MPGRTPFLECPLEPEASESMKRYNNSNGNNDNHREIHEQCRRANLRAGEGVAEGRGGGERGGARPSPGPHLDGGQRLAGLGAALPEDAAGGAALALVAEAHAALLGLLGDDQVRSRPGARRRGHKPPQGAAPGRRRGRGRGRRGAQGDGAQGGHPARHEARQPLARARRRPLQAEAVLLDVLVDDLCGRSKNWG